MRKIKKWLNEENIEWIDALEKYNEFKRKALGIGSELADFSIHLKKYLNL